MSDVLSFHNYRSADSLRRQIARLRADGRPVLCTEWLSRPQCAVETHLPVFAEHRVACFNWGLVAGRTQTIHSWRSTAGPDTAEPAEWFHDLLRPDGTPYREQEAETFRRLTARVST